MPAKWKYHNLIPHGFNTERETLHIFIRLKNLNLFILLYPEEYNVELKHVYIFVLKKNQTFMLCIFILCAKKFSCIFLFTGLWCYLYMFILYIAWNRKRSLRTYTAGIICIWLSASFEKIRICSRL